VSRSNAATPCFVRGENTIAALRDAVVTIAVATGHIEEIVVINEGDTSSWDIATDPVTDRDGFRELAGAASMRS
jgi:hypothetical protein